MLVTYNDLDSRKWVNSTVSLKISKRYFLVTWKEKLDYRKITDLHAQIDWILHSKPSRTNKEQPLLIKCKLKEIKTTLLYRSYTRERNEDPSASKQKATRQKLFPRELRKAAHLLYIKSSKLKAPSLNHAIFGKHLMIIHEIHAKLPPIRGESHKP